MNLCLSILAAMVMMHCGTGQKADILVEAEGFADCGGWVNDTQSMMQIGSPYLLAHGMGDPVKDAATTFTAPASGKYHLWVRTRDWTRQWGVTESPGRFQVIVNEKVAGGTFGTESADWHWQDGGIVRLKKGENRLVLHDLTGFEGRCDAVLFSADLTAAPPEKTCAFSSREAEDAGAYDLVVVGGGIAGCAAAVSAARLGCRVALIHNRPVLGGNNSSEVRVGLSGRIFQQPYPKLGALIDELGGVGFWNNVEAGEDPDCERSRNIKAVLEAHPEKLTHNAGPAGNYEDGKKIALLEAEPGITLYLGTQVIDAEMDGSRIVSVAGRNIFTGKDIVVSGALFADCTGDANLGYLVGADYRMGRESKAETGEADAPEKPDGLTMGMSVQWYSTDAGTVVPFPDCPWALQFNEDTFINTTRGDWDWEAGLLDDQIEDAEYIRDHALRAVYGNWAYLKNHSPVKDDYAGKKLEWVAYIGGKRESRRLLGDHILTEEDLLNTVRYEDETFTTTWEIDLHYPKYIPGFEGDPFLAQNTAPQIRPCTVPLRCLYSRNVDNLFMAGRNISATHIALGSVRVMRTGCMMGEVVGMAASICRRKGVDPRSVYQSYMPELRKLMSEGVARKSL